ncbi:zinc-dependent peptidase [Lacinutrix salivirga]
MSSNTLNVLILLQEKESPLVFRIIILLLTLVTTILVIVVLFRGVFNFFEMAQVELFRKKQFFNHIYFKKNQLPDEFKEILNQDFNFYNRLTPKQKTNFDHRVQFYITNWEFIGKDIEITTTMKVLVAATAAKLTFGYRDYKIETINKVIIYPKIYFSTINKEMHKGEFNMAYKALIFSWEDFLKGYKITNDNINLGVHECIHAMHFSFLKSRKYSTSSAIFLDSFYELTKMLDDNALLKQNLINSEYLRDYAFENQFEFISVIVENFIETPEQFRSKFPRIYAKVKEMLNFNFAGY